MAITKKTTHDVESIARLLEQDKDKEKFEALLSLVLAPQIQDLENAIFQILTDTILATAVGVQLDRFGTIVDQARNGQNDDDYRVTLQAKTILNNAQGTLEEIVQLIDLLTGGGLEIEIVEDFPAHFDAIINDPLPVGVDGPQISAFVLKGKPAGVKGIIQFHVAVPFQYDGGASNAYDLGKYGAAVAV